MTQLERLMRDYKITQTKLARDTGINQPEIAKGLKEGYFSPSRRKILSEWFDIDEQHLFTEVPEYEEV